MTIGQVESQARVEDMATELGVRATTMTGGLVENQERVEEEAAGRKDRPSFKRWPSINWLLSRYST